MLEPVKGYFRLSPDREVADATAISSNATKRVTDAAGNVVELKCTFDPETRGGSAPDGRKVKGRSTVVYGRDRGSGRGPALTTGCFGVEQPGRKARIS
jgi:glutaminyl-tRNA synthetase